jgi:hypothetical protein
MTTRELLVDCVRRKVVLGVDGGRVTYEAPRGTMTDNLIAELRRLKPVLLEVLPRLAGMRIHTEPVPTAKCAREALGGPGRCFSCGDAHDHPQAYGRCVWCSLALEAYYGTLHAGEDSMVFGDGEPHRRPA